MRQKTIVGLIMAAGATLMVAVGGWVMALIVLVLICFGVQEEFHALAQAGHRPVAWPTWVGMIVSIPLTLLIGTKMILPVIMAICQLFHFLFAVVIAILVMVVVYRLGALAINRYVSQPYIIESPAAVITGPLPTDTP